MVRQLDEFWSRASKLSPTRRIGAIEPWPVKSTPKPEKANEKRRLGVSDGVDSASRKEM